ncbi:MULTISPECIES: hypothetical protein, partial [unclassified Pseudoclavibacter]|uniref:hypothetical protein n=1 Tax=unclassified Pseudoclavibacter TaxID=2615177 RepID=UPI001BA43F32
RPDRCHRAHRSRGAESHGGIRGGPDGFVRDTSADADHFAPRTWTRRALWWIVALAGLLGAGAGFLILSGIFGLLDSSAQLWGLPPGVRLGGGVLCLAGFIGLLVWMAVGSRRRSATWRVQEST